jgi:RNase P/RNase MRP subunit POP5
MEKKLKPSSRENKRYVLFEGSREQAERAILEFIGILGYAQSGVSFPSQNVLAVNREMIDKVRSALVLSGIKVLRVSGTIRHIKEKCN